MDLFSTQPTFLDALLLLKSSRKLSLANNYLDVRKGVALRKFIKNEYCCLVELNLANGNLGNAGTQALFEGLRDNQTLKRLNISENKITDVAGNSICDYFYDEIAGKMSILNPDANKSSLTRSPTKLFQKFQGGKRPMNLQSLNLSMNSLSDLTCVPLAYNLHCNSELSNLHLGLNYLGEATGAAF